ncbi:MAG: hypothetical protein Q9209_003787 [Squamulea sp. 1 TL-2023]
MAKKRKSIPPSTTKMDVDSPAPAPPLSEKSILSANTRTGIAKPIRQPRGKGRRTQRLRKEKGAERAEEVHARTERKVERSRGRGKRKGERNAAWEELNKKIKGAVAAEVVARKRKVEGLGGDDREGKWVDEVEEDGAMLDVESSVEGKEKVGHAEDGTMARSKGGKSGEVEDEIL